MASTSDKNKKEKVEKQNKITKNDLEALQAKLDDKDRHRKFKEKMEQYALERERILNTREENEAKNLLSELKEKGKQTQENNRHNEESRRIDIEEKEKNYKFILDREKAMQDFLEKLLPTLESFAKYKLDCLMTMQKEIREDYDLQISTISEDIKQLEDKLEKAKTDGDGEELIRNKHLIEEKHNFRKLLFEGKNSFIDTSWNDIKGVEPSIGNSPLLTNNIAGVIENN